MAPGRTPAATYRDPLDEIWAGAARRIGFTVERTRDAYAATDGAGVIRVGEADLLDRDDCLAQIVFHELCHALVEGEAAWRRADWGLDNTGERDGDREEACLRVQATLAGRHGLRRALAATTEHRPFYDALPEDAAAGQPLVLAALARSARHPFAPHLDAALAATARVLQDAAMFAPEGSLARLVADRHPLGFALGHDGESCGSCVWRNRGRCLHAGARAEEAWPACARWEPSLDCLACGACCREGFDVVALEPKDRFIKRHPELVVTSGGHLEVLRDGARCAALRVDGHRYAGCAVYAARPRTCRDFPLAGDACLLARRRVGLAALSPT